MALGTATVVKKSAAQGPLRADIISFAGDGAYPGGGTAAFQDYVRAALDVGNVEVLGVVQVDGSGYVLRYNKGTDKLMVFEGNYDASDGPLQESSTANLSGQTFKVLVISE